MDKRKEVVKDGSQDEKAQEPLLGSSTATKPVILPGANRRTSQEMGKAIQTYKPSKNIDICSELMGNWGLWQLRTVSIVYLTKIPAAWFMACIIFTAPQPWYGEYRCNLSEFENTTVANWINISHPLQIMPDGTYEENYCYVSMAHDFNFIDKNHTGETTTIPCPSFDYSLDLPTTLITQFDLVCSRNILIAITQCFHLFGVLIGGVLATEFMEYWSPKVVMMAGMIALIPCGVTTGYIPWFWLHVAFRCMSAACCALSFTPGGVIMGDIVGGRQKTIVSANFEQFWSVGVILLPAIGYFTNTWGQIYLTITLPTFIIMVLWIWVPDSPRWHLNKDNIKKVKLILEEAVRVNKSEANIPSNIDELLYEQATAGHASDEKLAPQNNWKHLWSLPGSSYKIILLFTSWSLIFTCYYGTLLNIRSFGREYLYITTAIAAACEMIGGFIGFQIIMHSNYKWKIASAIATVTGLLNCIIWLMPSHVDGNHMLLDLMIISMLNKIGISALLCVLTTCSAELFPLPHKKRVVFAATVSARIVFMTAPLIGVTAKYGDAVSLTFFGILTAIGAICAFGMAPVKNTSSNLPPVLGVPKIWNVNSDPNNFNTKL